MLKYRNGLKDIPVYNTKEQDWDIKVNANECNMNLPPVVEERLMVLLYCLAYNRYQLFLGSLFMLRLLRRQEYLSS